MDKFQQYKEIFNSNALDYNEILHDKLTKYARFLAEYNEKVNLTTITDYDEVMIKHFLDSILLIKQYDLPEGASLIDVGTGAGFPSVPLKLYRPDLKITLLDSLNKRIIFLKELCGLLEIEVKCIHGRAELTAREEMYRESFDIATARAVAPLNVLAEYCLPFVKVGGVFIAMKGPNEDISTAKNAVKLMKSEIIAEKSYFLNNEESRRAIVIKKLSQISTKYPRNSGQIKAKPL